ncbi:MAG: lipopolysaccharide transport system permease protein [Crocinitomicaceae bacterium]|jgi:lipopolysaccharide transport system permease protein
MGKTVINNKAASSGEYLRSISQYRQLIFSFAKRDLKARFVQTKLGLLWIIIQPLIALTIFTIFFDQLIKLETGNVPYVAFAFSGMTIWYFFTNMVHSAGTALINSQELIRKVYFPKILLPISKVLVATVEFFVAFVLLIAIMIILGMDFSPKVLLFPIAIMMTALVGSCVAIWLNVLTVKNRDLQHFIPYLTNFGIWITPVFYPTTLIPEAFRDYIYYLNPIATTIDFLRSLLFDLTFNWSYCLSFLPVLILLLIGIRIFKNRERNMVDYL